MGIFLNNAIWVMALVLTLLTPVLCYIIEDQKEEIRTLEIKLQEKCKIRSTN